MIILASAVVAIWLYLLLERGGFWRFRVEMQPGSTGREACPVIVVVMPARNEADVVGRAVASLASQQYAGRFHIILVDDASDDGTAEAARQAAPETVLTIIQAGPVPPGWTGKLWAVNAGIRHAAAYDPDYFLLTDADIVHPPDNLAILTGRDGYDLVSVMATLHCETVAECALIPAFVFFFFMLYPPAWVRDPRRATAAAAGGCILIRRAALERIGGIEAIAGELIDDCALARAVKQTGGRIWLGLGPRMRSLREYHSFAEIGRMISRTAFTQLRHSYWLLAGAVAGMLITFVLPAVLAVAGHHYIRAAATCAWLLMAIAYLPSLRFYGVNPLWAPLLPLVATFYTGATVASALSHARGKGGNWKGRIQGTVKDAPPPMA